MAAELTASDFAELRDLIERAKSAPPTQSARVIGKVIQATRPVKERPPRKPNRPALPGDDTFTPEQKRRRAYAATVVRHTLGIWQLEKIKAGRPLTPEERAARIELGWPNRTALVSLDRDEPDVLQAAIDIVGGNAADAVNGTL